MKRGARPIIWRAILAALIVTVGAAPFSNFHWTLYDIKAHDPVSGAHPEFVSAPVAIVASPVTDLTWRVCPALAEMLLAAAAALGVFALLGGNRACGSQETRCRHCEAVLRGLSEAKCPACKEAL